MWRHLRSEILAAGALLAWAASAAAATPVQQSQMPAAGTGQKIAAVAIQNVASGCFYDRGFRRVIRRHAKEVKYCYEQALRRRSDLSGRVVLQLTIAADGSVAATAIISDEIQESGLAVCMSAAAARWQFVPAAGEEVAVITYPFILQPAPASGLAAEEAQRSAIRACHEQALRRNLDESGALTLRISLDATARVRTATVIETSISDTQLLACITSAVQRWRFTDAESNSTLEKTLWLQSAD